MEIIKKGEVIIEDGEIVGIKNWELADFYWPIKGSDAQTLADAIRDKVK